MARSLGDEIREMRALSIAAMGEAYEGDVAAALRFAEPAARLADALTDNDLAALRESLCVLGWTEAFLESHTHTDAARHADRGLDIARRTGQLYLLPQILVRKAYIDLTACRVTPVLREIPARWTAPRKPWQRPVRTTTGGRRWPGACSPTRR